MWKMNNQQIEKKEGEGYPVKYSPSFTAELNLCDTCRRFLKNRNSLFIGQVKRASMTIETALVLPLFLFAMIAILQFASLQITASALLAGMHETAKEMAVYAYIQDMGISAGDSIAADIVTGGISAVYAKGKIEELSGGAAKDGGFHLLQSSFLVNEMIDLAGTYQKKNTLSVIPVKIPMVVLRARVRAWTGREGRNSPKDSEEHSEGEEEDHSKVYVTATGSVYHKDPNCTHIKLSISRVSKSSIGGRRNSHGEKYHACEKCGANAGGEVYITSNGNRYHSSLECSGIKRTVKECTLSEVNGMRACSKCGK